ncbi:unnamed protein product [Allacma fusca]|uniref:Uncharacterized protein n=1 Tax=Allacma fusca TaxID=39272 RepID=A0A8J2P7Z4_9HEXA|nr:unnamed protein product [Allacma fusca]
MNKVLLSLVVLAVIFAVAVNAGANEGVGCYWTGCQSKEHGAKCGTGLIARAQADCNHGQVNVRCCRG